MTKGAPEKKKFYHINNFILQYMLQNIYKGYLKVKDLLTFDTSNGKILILPWPKNLSFPLVLKCRYRD